MQELVEYQGSGIIIMSCSKCNMKCKHCYVTYKGNFDPNELVIMCDNLIKKYDVFINGTEVLLNEGYLESLSITKQQRVLTNGLIIYEKPDLIKKVKDCNVDAIAMSYHFNTNGKISDTSLEMIKTNIMNIKRIGLESILLCTITKDNYDKVYEIVTRAVDLGANSIKFFNYLKTGNALNQNENLVLNDEMIRVFFNQYEAARLKYPKETISILRNGTFGPNMEYSNRTFECNACYDMITIAPDKKVYPCIYLIYPEYVIGEYKDGKVYVQKEFNHTRKRCLAMEKYNNNCDITI